MLPLSTPQANKSTGNRDAQLNDARLYFLRASANHLAFTGSATSAFINSQADQVAFQAGETVKATKRHKTQYRDTCRACGNLFVPGISSLTSVKSDRVRLHGAKHSRTQNDSKIGATRPSLKHRIIDCQRCNTRTRTAIQPDTSNVKTLLNRKPTRLPFSPGSDRKKDTEVLPPGDGLPTQSSSIGADIAKPRNSAKARAKARKKGLEAELAKSKKSASASNGLNFDLMDFMSSG